MMKKWICCVIAVVLVIGCLPVLAASGSLNASVSAGSVTVGNTVTVTLQYNGGGAHVGSLDARFRYNAAAFQYVSCSGASAAGEAGLLRLSWYADGATAPTAVTVKITMKAIAAGAGDFALETTEFINDDDYSSLGTPGKAFSVSATNPTLSGNANLSSLKPSSGTLTPAFKAGTTNYTVTVPYTTSSLSLSVTTADKKAKTSVSGSNTLKVGKNTQTVTVTAQNGTTKKYTVVITRSAGDDKDPSDDPQKPAKEQLEVEVGGALFDVADTQPDAELPDGFEWGVTTINGVAVSAARQEESGMVLVYLKTKKTEEKPSEGAFYLYYETEGTFEKFCPLTVKKKTYVLLDLPDGMAAPAGTTVSDFTFENEGGFHEVFSYEDTQLEDFLIVYAAPVGGTPGLYVYDRAEGTFQRYREIAAPADVTPVEDPEPASPSVIETVKNFIQTHRNAVLIGGGAALAILLIVVIVVLSVSSARRKKKNCKH